MQVYELITCVRRANENAGNVISGVQFLINIYITGVKLRVATTDLCLMSLLCFRSTSNGIERSSPSHHPINVVLLFGI